MSRAKDWAFPSETWDGMMLRTGETL